MKLEPKHVILAIVLLAGLLMSVLTGSFAYYTNEGFGFPLDDPWIHLQFAKNLHDYGSFSYFKDQLATSGSTSPLYTLLLAVGFFFTQNEMVLSYVLGVAFFLAGGFFMFRIADRGFKDARAPAFVATLLLVLEPHLQWIALSGMETTFFIFLLLATLWYYGSDRPYAFGLCAGLLIWTRPEAVIFFGALVADALYRRVILRQQVKASAWLVRAGVVVLVLGAGYVLFNVLLSGSILPNTYAAKIKYYSSGQTNFPLLVWQFLSDGPLVVFAPFTLAGILFVLWDVGRRKENVFIVPLLFSAGMFLAYWMKLPYLYQNGRYMMPILPFTILLGIHGALRLLEILTGVVKEGRQVQRLVVPLLSLFVVLFAFGSWKSRVVYQDYCKYISDRQVKTARWLKDHLPEDAVVATHDVGAIAFYSERRIVDMVGLVSPEMIQNIGDLGRLKQFLLSQGVTHLALLRNWFEVVNVNSIYHTDEQTPEIMEVFAFDPAKTHFTPKEVNVLTDQSWYFLSRGDVERGGPLIERAVSLDSLSSRAHHHFGWALMMVGQFDRAEAELRRAIDLNPKYWTAYFALAQVPLRQLNFREGIARLERLLAMNPKMLPAEQQVAQVYEHLGDTTRARMHLENYRKRMEELQEGQ